MDKKLISIIIVTFNNEEYIAECISSLKNIQINYEVILIDNNSTDQSLNIIKTTFNSLGNVNYLIIENKTNRGFSQAVNQGIKKSKGYFICLLGSDCQIKKNTMEYLSSFLVKHPDTGLVAPQLISSSGTILASCRRLITTSDILLELSGLPRLFPERIKPEWKTVPLDKISPIEVEQPEASCIMTHRKAIDKVGLMDERFYIFFNDVDWSRRFLEKGYKIMYLPQVKVVHVKGGSIYKNRIPMIWKSHRDLYRYYLKYAKNLRKKLIIPILGFLLILTAALRSLIYLLNESFPQKARK